VVTVPTSVTNWCVAGSQTVTLADTDFTNNQQNDTTVSLTSGESNDSSTLQWTTGSNDDGTDRITVDTEKGERVRIKIDTVGKTSRSKTLSSESLTTITAEF